MSHLRIWMSATGSAVAVLAVNTQDNCYFNGDPALLARAQGADIQRLTPRAAA